MHDLRRPSNEETEDILGQTKGVATPATSPRRPTVRELRHPSNEETEDILRKLVGGSGRYLVWAYPSK